MAALQERDGGTLISHDIMTGKLLRQYSLLLLLVFVAVFIYAANPGDESIRTWSSNIGAGLIGSLVVIFLIDRSLEGSRQAEQQRIRAVAFAHLRMPLLRQLYLLGNWYKAAAYRPDNPPADFSALFGDDYFDQVGHLDLSKAGPTTPPVDWFQYNRSELNFVVDAIQRVIDKYAVFLSPTLIELLEAVTASDIVGMMRAFGEMDLPRFDQQRGFDRQYNLFDEPSTKQALKSHVQGVVALLDYFNANSGEPIGLDSLSLWREDTAPEFASARIDKG